MTVYISEGKEGAIKISQVPLCKSRANSPQSPEHGVSHVNVELSPATKIRCTFLSLSTPCTRKWIFSIEPFPSLPGHPLPINRCPSNPRYSTSKRWRITCGSSEKVSPKTGEASFPPKKTQATEKSNRTDKRMFFLRIIRKKSLPSRWTQTREETRQKYGIYYLYRNPSSIREMTKRWISLVPS